MRGSARICIILGSMALVAALVLLLLWNPDTGAERASGEPLLFYCAAGIKPPVEEVVKEYEEEFDVPIRVQYGGSGTLLSNLRVAGTGDVYLAGDASYVRIAREQGLVAESIPLATMRPVVATAKGNPKGIRSVRDLLRDDVRVALGNPDAASVGKQTRHAMTKAGLWDSLKDAVQSRGVFKPTVNDVANDIKIGTVDAGVIWDSTARQYPELGIATPLIDDGEFVMQVTIAVLESTEQPTAALRFARYLSARDKGLKAFERHHYTVVQGDAWAREPEILLLSGGEQQRVALGRALSARPRILCMDEPLGCLDEETHGEICELLRTITQEVHVTTLHVTHSMREARALADRIYRVEDGTIADVTG